MLLTYLATVIYVQSVRTDSPAPYTVHRTAYTVVPYIVYRVVPGIVRQSPSSIVSPVVLEAVCRGTRAAVVRGAQEIPRPIVPETARAATGRVVLLVVSAAVPHAVRHVICSSGRYAVYRIFTPVVSRVHRFVFSSPSSSGFGPQTWNRHRSHECTKGTKPRGAGCHKSVSFRFRVLASEAPIGQCVAGYVGFGFQIPY